MLMKPGKDGLQCLLEYVIPVFHKTVVCIHMYFFSSYLTLN